MDTGIKPRIQYKIRKINSVEKIKNLQIGDLVIVYTEEPIDRNIYALQSKNSGEYIFVTNVVDCNYNPRLAVIKTSLEKMVASDGIIKTQDTARYLKYGENKILYEKAVDLFEKKKIV